MADLLDRQAPEGEGTVVEGAEAAEDGTMTSHRSTPRSAAFRSFIAQGWGPRPAEDLEAAGVAPFAARRREVLSSLFPGEVLVVPAGTLVRRSNDCDYRFRPHSAFAHLTVWAPTARRTPSWCCFPTAEGHDAVLYVRPQAARDTEEFFADARYGELWVGPRTTLPPSPPRRVSPATTSPRSRRGERGARGRSRVAHRPGRRPGGHRARHAAAGPGGREGTREGRRGVRHGAVRAAPGQGRVGGRATA